MPMYRITHKPDYQNITEVEVVEFDGMDEDEHGFSFRTNYVGVGLFLAKSTVTRVERISDGGSE